MEGMLNLPTTETRVRGEIRAERIMQDAPADHGRQDGPTRLARAGSIDRSGSKGSLSGRGGRHHVGQFYIRPSGGSAGGRSSEKPLVDLTGDDPRPADTGQERANQRSDCQRSGDLSRRCRPQQYCVLERPVQTPGDDRRERSQEYVADYAGADNALVHFRNDEAVIGQQRVDDATDRTCGGDGAEDGLNRGRGGSLLNGAEQIRGSSRHGASPKYWVRLSPCSW